MTKQLLAALKSYIELPIREKMLFIQQIQKIEKMNKIVRSEYEGTLISSAASR